VKENSKKNENEIALLQSKEKGNSKKFKHEQKKHVKNLVVMQN